MKKMIHFSKAQKFLESCNPETIDYLKEYIDEIDNLIVLDCNGYDWVEIDPTEEINKIKLRYMMFGIDEDLIDSQEEFEAVYDALRQIGYTGKEGTK